MPNQCMVSAILKVLHNISVLCILTVISVIYLERNQTLDKDPFVAILEVKSSRKLIQVALKEVETVDRKVYNC